MALVNPNQPIHPAFDERISVKVEGQLPAFVKQDHSTFVAFMEAYYEYMEQTGKPYEIIGNLHHYNNIDKTTDDFLNYFKNQFGRDIPHTIFENSNKPFVLKHLRDFYRTKGSEKSFQFLFRLLYKEEIDFYYPGRDMLRVSDGRYTKNSIIRVIDSSGTDAIFTIVGKKITGNSSGATAVVETVLNENIGSFVASTVFLSSILGVFSVGEIISDGTSSFTTGGMITSYAITGLGNNYVLGDIVPVTGGGNASGSFISISELTSGKVTTTTIVSGGTGYVVGDKLTISNWNAFAIDGRSASILVKTVDGSGTITALEIEHSGRGYTSVPTISGGGTGTGANITLAGWGIGGVKTLNIVNGGYGFSENVTLDFSSLGDGTATGIASVGAYEDNYQKGFTTNDGFLSGAKYIQDSKYYQAFSYVLTTSKTVDKWRDSVKRLAHPAGLSLFGNLEIVSLINTDFKITGIPQRRDYKIIFHAGKSTPVVLDLKVDSCTPWLLDPPGIVPKVFYPVNDGTFYYAATKCQIYEKDLAIQYLTTFSSEDYLQISESETLPPNPDIEMGLITQSVILKTDIEDWGDLHSRAQMRLGPIRKTLDQQKFNKFGGFSQEIGVGTESGTTINSFRETLIDDYIYARGIKTKLVMNSTVTKYTNGAENTSLPPS